MTLGGLAIAIGVVVDDAVIDVENIVRRVRENARLAAPRPFAHVRCIIDLRGVTRHNCMASKNPFGDKLMEPPNTILGNAVEAHQLICSQKTFELHLTNQ
jgi:hypothetical protein